MAQTIINKTLLTIKSYVTVNGETKLIVKCNTDKTYISDLTITDTNTIEANKIKQEDFVYNVSSGKLELKSICID